VSDVNRTVCVGKCSSDCVSFCSKWHKNNFYKNKSFFFGGLLFCVGQSKFIISESYTFGQIAEQKASAYLKNKGCTILEQNYRYRKVEIDIIATQDDFIFVVEVKARSSSFFGNPESFVSKKKIQLLIMVIDAYIQNKKLQGEVRLEISTYLVDKGQWKREHIENAFYPF
tara:strand:+ start:439 stop:948 length:510 start_codon:yes stop_codon:yes gene_type:complete